MADEQELAPAEELEPTDVPETEEKPDPDVNDEAPELGPVEKLASEEGWVPKDKFTGDPDKWRPADEYLRVGKQNVRSMSRELKGVKETVSNMARTSAALFEQQIQEQRAKLESQFNQAVEEGDNVTARAAGDRLNQLPTALPQPQETEVSDFVERNKSWFNVDPLATDRAEQVAQAYFKRGHSPADQVAAAERVIRKEFPELFPAPAKAPPTVARPPSRMASTSNRGKGFHDLPHEAQKVARDMVERGQLPDVDHYVRQWFKKEQVG